MREGCLFICYKQIESKLSTKYMKSRSTCGKVPGLGLWRQIRLSVLSEGVNARLVSQTCRCRRNVAQAVQTSDANNAVLQGRGEGNSRGEPSCDVIRNISLLLIVARVRNVRHNRLEVDALPRAERKKHDPSSTGRTVPTMVPSEGM